MRFPIVTNTVRVSSEKVPRIILCYLNIIKYWNDEFDSEEAEQNSENETILQQF